MEFCHRREKAFDLLRSVTPENAPALYLGAEVAWYPSLAREPLNLLTLGNSSYFLLELPFEPWSGRILDQLYQLTCITGLTPILAHVERYRSIQSEHQMAELLAMGLPMQLNADSLLSWKSRGSCKKLMRTGRWHLSSDCHNLKRRPPRMGKAIRFLSAEEAEQLTAWTPGKEENSP